MFKKLSLILLAVVLVLTLVACGKSDNKKDDGDKNPASSNVSSGDPTQDYNKDEFDENPITNEELEDLWDQITDDDAQIGGVDDRDESSSETSTSSGNSSTTTSSGSSSAGSSSTESSASSGSSSTESSAFSGSAVIGTVPGAIF